MSPMAIIGLIDLGNHHIQDAEPRDFLAWERPVGEVQSKMHAMPMTLHFSASPQTTMNAQCNWESSVAQQMRKIYWVPAFLFTVRLNIYNPNENLLISTKCRKCTLEIHFSLHPEFQNCNPSILDCNELAPNEWTIRKKSMKCQFMLSFLL